ncbi:MAG: magnesium transporter CorA family protein, partial [Ruthenibacterium lactatiformans]
TEENIITVCLKESALARAFSESPVKNFSTKKKNRMTLQLLYRNATLFLFYLREVDKASSRVENELHLSMKNKELIQMLGLEKSLVYFSTSLKGNEIVLEKLLRMDFVKDYPDDTELLEDVIIENKQAIEMSNIYRDILSGTMDAFASVISNNLNIVMKVLAAVTIILTIPSIIFGLWGSNVPVPFESSPYGFFAIIGIAALCTAVAVVVMVRKKWL